MVSETAAGHRSRQPAVAAGALQSRSRRGAATARRSTAPCAAGCRCRREFCTACPTSLSFEKAALTEPCCVAYNAVVNNGRIKPGDRILVLGPGPIGLLCAAMARLQGAIVGVAGLERDRPRLKIAEGYGCQAIVSGVEDWAREGDGLGVDGVIDAAGVSATLKMAIDLVRPAGWISKVGWGPQPVEFQPRSAGAKEHHAARQLQPQLADLGARDPPAGDRYAEHRRR